MKVLLFEFNDNLNSDICGSSNVAVHSPGSPAYNASSALQFATSETLTITVASPPEIWTYCFWFKPVSSTDAPAFLTGIRNITIKIASASILTNYIVGTTEVNSGDNVTAGTWYFMALTYDGTTKDLYLDPAPSASPIVTGTEADSSTDFTPVHALGNTHLIDEIALYTRVLTVDELAAVRAASEHAV